MSGEDVKESVMEAAKRVFGERLPMRLKVEDWAERNGHAPVRLSINAEEAVMGCECGAVPGNYERWLGHAAAHRHEALWGQS